MLMVLDYEWNGILKLKYDVRQSLQEYGFAIRFAYKEDAESFYDCLIPDDDQSYYLCTLSVEEIRDIVDEHPEIPIRAEDVDKTGIGELLYLLDLYCNLGDVLNLEDADKVNCNDIEFDTKIPEDSIDSEKNPKGNKNMLLSMTEEKAQMALRTINRYNLNVLASYYNSFGYESLSKTDISKIKHCKRVLWLCGETVRTFMKKIKSEYGKLYWLKDGEYIELKSKSKSKKMTHGNSPRESIT